MRDNSKKQIGNFIPGWIFEYPNDFYENQDQIYLKFEQLTDWMRLNKIDEDIHISFSIIGDKNLRSSKEDKQHDNLLVNILLDMKTQSVYQKKYISISSRIYDRFNNK